MATEQSRTDGANTSVSDDKPDFLIPGVRCGIEMVLAGGLIVLVGLPAENDIYFGGVITLAIIVMVTILFWGINRQIEQWIAAAQ
ncbi:hypothetical protein ACFQJ7_04435 [Halovenus rubra]|uniref:Uncharacterized protein n=2 Tax=Halovenus rubra TaxID=869890 RepID=A0ACC7DY67_9EURY|nr:hypothetical protein [Halovenus rubra]